MNTESELVGRSLENSHSKASVLDTQETVTGSAAKNRTDGLLDDYAEESMNFSDILHSEYYKTPKKVTQESVVPTKFAAPSKSEVKIDLETQHLGKRSAFEMKYLDKSLNKYMEKTLVRRSKRLLNKVSPKGYSEISLGPEKEDNADLSNCMPLNLVQEESNASTNFDCSRETCIQQDTPGQSQFFKLLKLGDDQYLSQKSASLKLDSWFHPSRTTVSSQELANHSARAERVITICQSISNQAHSLLHSLSKMNTLRAPLSGPLLTESHHSSQPLPLSTTMINHYTNDDKADSLSLHNFASDSCAESVVQSFGVDDLPDSLKDLYVKFVKLDFIVHEVIKMKKLSLLNGQLDFVQKSGCR